MVVYCFLCLYFCVFFFQAEDGIRDVAVTGVQTCALPISVKINYELLGNQLPHIHWHIIPRLADDPSPREAVWTVKHDPKRLSPHELRERVSHIQNHLSIRRGTENSQHGHVPSKK